MIELCNTCRIRPRLVSCVDCKECEQCRNERLKGYAAVFMEKRRMEKSQEPQPKFKPGDAVRPVNSRFVVVAVAGMANPMNSQPITQGYVVVARGRQILLMDESYLEAE